MSYAVIHGCFVSDLNKTKRPVRRTPNAGSFVFQPSSLGQRTLMTEFGLGANAARAVEVRLEGVEALESGFMGQHQCLSLALGARTRMLQALGTGSEGGTLDPEHPVRAAARGYLFARSVDRGGRLIAFAFAGDCSTPDGTRLFVEPKHLRDSVNATLLREGWAYSSCYDSLPAPLRADLIELTRRARGQNLGLWPKAAALPGRPFRLSGGTLASCVMFPKLFRRLVEYTSEGNASLQGFRAWLRGSPHRDEMLLLPNQEVGRLHDVVEVVGEQIRLTRNSEEFIVLKTSAAPLARAQRDASEAPLRIIAAVVEPLDADADHKTVTLLNTTARSIGLETFTLKDRVGRALGLQGHLGPGEARRFRLGHLLLGADRLFGLSLLHGDKVVDHVAFGPREGHPPGASLVF